MANMPNSINVDFVFDCAEDVKVMLDDFAFAPTRAHAEDAGLDLRAPEDAIVPAHGWAVFNTGVHVLIPKNFAGVLKSKSGLNVKSDITSSGLVDAGYTGSIVVKLYNHGDTAYKVSRGDKISQLVIIPIVTPKLVLVDSFEETARGDNGFGSSGR